MPRKKKEPTNEEKSLPQNLSYEDIETVRIISTNIGDNGKSFSIEYVNDKNDSIIVPCSRKLYKAMEEDGVVQNYRVIFTLHKNPKTNLIDFISTRPKDIYGAYEVEYEEDMKMPDKDIYKGPPDKK